MKRITTIAWEEMIITISMRMKNKINSRNNGRNS
jgi:hypothetical protein